jgi:hypothetical protein
MNDRHPLWRFLLCALAIWPVPRQIAEHFYNTQPFARFSGASEGLDGDDSYSAADCEAL